MARTRVAQRLRMERDADGAFVQSLGRMAADAAAVLLRFAVRRDGELRIPDGRRVRDDIDRAMWREVVRPYFIGGGDDAFEGPAAQSPYARLLVEWMRRSIEVQVDVHLAVLERYARRDGLVWGWLTGPRAAGQMREMARGERPDAALIHLYEMGWDDGHVCGEGCNHTHGVVREIEDRRLIYDPYHLFVYGDSPYRLSDRVWRTSIEVRANIDRVVAYHLPQGTGAVRMAEELRRYLQPGEAPVMTRTPYGREGSYSARRLARTEVTAAGGRAFINAAQANPYVGAVRWSRTAFGQPCPICDPKVGVYPVDEVPLYPGHPHCMCTLSPEVVANPAAVTEALRREIEARTEYAETLRGAFNRDWMIEGLLLGWFVWEVVERLGD